MKIVLLAIPALVVFCVCVAVRIDRLEQDLRSAREEMAALRDEVREKWLGPLDEPELPPPPLIIEGIDARCAL